MRLDATDSKKCNMLLSLINTHPLPDTETLSEVTIIESEWTSFELQKQYITLLNDLFESMKKKAEIFQE